MKFKANKVDLDLELTTLVGEEINLEPKVLVTAEEAVKIIDKWTKLESNDEIGKVDLLAKELSIVYEKEPSWWLQNFDVATLSEILKFVAESMGGVRKNEDSSN